MSVNQNVPTCVASGTNNGCRPNPDYANNSQYSSAGDSNYHGLHVSFMQRPARWGHYRVSYTLSKSMNNLGEFFFSSPIDPFDLSKDWGRSDDDQRHRLVIHGAVQTSMAPAATAWEYLTHGFQVSGMLQAYSALPFNITSGVTTIQGTAGRPIVNGEFIERNAGIGSDFLSLNMRVSRAVPRQWPRPARGAGRRFQPDEPSQRADAKHELRRRCVPDQPVAYLQSDHRRWRTAVIPIRDSAALLRIGEAARRCQRCWKATV